MYILTILVLCKTNSFASIKSLKTTAMKKIIIAMSAILLFISCGKNKAPENSIAQLGRDLDVSSTKSITDKKEDFISNNIDTVAKQQQNDPDNSKQGQQTPPTRIDWDKKIIKNANLNLEIKDYNAYNTSLRQKIKQFGGYVAQEEQNQSDYKIENSLVIKVPVDQFDEAVNSISANAKELKEKKITSQDVTTEVIDTRSRLEAKKQVRLRYLDLLKQAKNMEEILSVQAEINGIQEQIESAAGRIEYLQHSSSFSTINLSFYQVLNAAASDNDKPPTFATRIANAFKLGWSWIVELSIGLVSIWPLLLVVFGLIILYKRAQKPKIKQA